MFISLDSEKKSSLLSEEQQATSTLVEIIRQSIQQNDVLKPINLLSQQMKGRWEKAKVTIQYFSLDVTGNNFMILKNYFQNSPVVKGNTYSLWNIGFFFKCCPSIYIHTSAQT